MNERFPTMNYQLRFTTVPAIRNLLAETIEAIARMEQFWQTLRLADRKSFCQRYPLQAFEAGLVEMTIPDKPNSLQEQYRLTAKDQQSL